jgi:hypothetical protein
MAQRGGGGTGRLWSAYWRMLTYAHVCLRMLTYADVCWRMLTYADVCVVVKVLDASGVPTGVAATTRFRLVGNL